MKNNPCPNRILCLYIFGTLSCVFAFTVMANFQMQHTFVILIPSYLQAGLIYMKIYGRLWGYHNLPIGFWLLAPILLWPLCLTYDLCAWLFRKIVSS